MSAPPAIVILGPGATDTAQRIKARYAGAQVHALRKRVEGDVAFDELGAHLRELYRRGIPIVALCAAGIVIRAVAPLLTDKGAEPPVLAVAEDGSAVVPLLGGLSGVNVLAREIADALRVAPAITTSGELRFGACVLNPPDGYALADIGAGKRFVSDLLAGASTRVEGDAQWLDRVALPRDPAAERAIRVTPHPAQRYSGDLVIHPRSVIVAVGGFEPDVGKKHEPSTGTTHAAAGGIKRAASDSSSNASSDLASDITSHLASHDLAPLALAAIVAPAAGTLDVELADVANALGVPLRFVDSADAGDGDSAAAVLSAALAGRAAKRFDDDARSTGVAVALCDAPVAPESIGRARGRLTVLGLGPGSAELMTSAARTALAEATDILGYATYVRMAGPFRTGQRVHETDNREEMQRARHAFELAAQGRRVAMVSSGDPGVFAMAAAVLEALDASGDPRWAAVELDIVPGVSAALATAAQAGAPLGHDFCVISLSDNLKPWDVIERRIAYAAQADLVMAFYNPVSRARPWQLDRALDVVRGVRESGTVVVLGRDIGRPGATLVTTTLGALDARQVDMRTMVIVGSSKTRRFARDGGREWVYTPRWYA